MTVVVVSGGFDPIHSGHIRYLNSASELGEKLIVCLNSDNWLKNKKGKSFLPFDERKIILENINCVDEVIGFEDDPQGSCINGLKKIKEKYPNKKIIFCNGGDRNKENIPELNLNGIEFEFEVGGVIKKNSSSQILKSWSQNITERRWGLYDVLYSKKNIKVKELCVNARSGMSFQKHSHRNEIWLVYEGKCEVFFSKTSESEKKSIILKRDDYFIVSKDMWHQITNPYNKECKIIEIQYGSKVEEEDIKRLFYYNQES